ncbi:MAG TPA: Si-specific NAD(P)(+) transhydrogenase [Methylomirabilota bacterium]|nr:Si-specific NAD(P)(+) transhydrogenase [Methylomirabilota bacterium]
MAEGYDFDLIAIGSGPAGQRAAIQAAKLGKRAAVVERQRVVGGVSVQTGTIPSKTFREAIWALGGAHGGRPAPAGTRPTAEQLLARVGEVVAREIDVITDQLQRNEVAVIRGAGEFRDPHTILVRAEAGSQSVSAATILIAVGTRAMTPPGAVLDGEVAITSDDIVHLKRLPHAMTVVGGGVIGMEYASMFAALGIEVTVVERRDRVLDFVDREIVDELIHQMRNCRVTFRLGEAVERFDIAPGPPRRGVVCLESGKRIVSELVLFSAGRIGATDALNLAAAGLSADARGRISVDEHFRTRVPHIYAAGDVIGYPSLAATSSEQGRLAACHAFGRDAGPMPAHFPVGIYAIPEISMVGATEEELTAAKVPYETGVARYREIARGQILGDDTGLFKMLFHREDRRLLGVHAIGTGATELIHIGQAVLALGGGLDYFLHTVFNYPTLAECYKVAALDAANKLASGE